VLYIGRISFGLHLAAWERVQEAKRILDRFCGLAETVGMERKARHREGFCET